jgi:hypothetical protein
MFYTGEPTPVTPVVLDVVERLGSSCVHRVDGTYRLSTQRYDEDAAPADRLESDDVAFLVEVMHVQTRSVEATNDWWPETIEPIVKDIGGGRVVKARKDAGHMLFVTAQGPDGDTVLGSLSCMPTCWQGEVILGTRTFSASMIVNEAHRGTGLARAMHDFVEEITGLPMAPHGRRNVQGYLSDMGAEFWRKRAAARPVPGYDDPDADRREEKWDRAERLLGLSRLDRTSPMLAIALAELSSGRISLLVEPRERGFPVMKAWCLGLDGDVEMGLRGTTSPVSPSPGSKEYSTKDAIELLRSIYASLDLDHRFAELMDECRECAAELAAYEKTIAERLAEATASPPSP